MKYLDERIEFTFSISTPRPDYGVYTYALFSYDVSDENWERLRFTGNFYYRRDGSYTFDVTDIIRSLKEVVPKQYITTSGSGYNSTHDGFLHDRFKIKVYFDNTTPLDSGWKNVAMCYRYPNYTAFSQGDNVFFDPYTGTTQNEINAAIQGSKIDKYVLVPHYPLKETQVYKYVQNFVLNANRQQFKLDYDRDDYWYTDTATFDNSQAENGALIIKDIAHMFPWGTDQDFDEAKGDLYVLENDTDRNIAVFDECYKRYYLFWQDRFGGFQSQAFNDYSTYSETFDVTETQNYINERKKSFIQIQPKWKLNSGWISEDIYPLYESILVSPILLLYDSKEDRLYEVIVNTNYTEKTYRSEKKLLNINLDLEGTTKQNITY